MNDPELLHILEPAAVLTMAVPAFWEKRRADTAESETNSVIACYGPDDDAVVVQPSIFPST